MRKADCGMPPTSVRVLRVHPSTRPRYPIPDQDNELLSPANPRELLLVLSFESVEIAPEFLLALEGSRRIETARNGRLVFDAALGDPRLVDSFLAGNRFPLRIGQRHGCDAALLILLA